LYWGKVNAKVQTICEEAFKDGKVSTLAEAAKHLAKWVFLWTRLACILNIPSRGFKLYIDDDRKKHGNKKNNSGLECLPADVSSADFFQDAIDSALQATAAGTSIQCSSDDNEDEEDGEVGDHADECTEQAEPEDWSMQTIEGRSIHISLFLCENILVPVILFAWYEV
jgi:hypothetical protein